MKKKFKNSILIVMFATLGLSNVANGQAAYEAIKSRVAEYLRDNFNSSKSYTAPGEYLFAADIYKYGNISLTDVSEGTSGTLEVEGNFFAESKKNSSKTTKYEFIATLKQVLDNYTVKSLKARWFGSSGSYTNY